MVTWSRFMASTSEPLSCLQHNVPPLRRNTQSTTPLAPSLNQILHPLPLPPFPPPHNRTMPTNLTLFSIHAILLLSTDDRTRILAKYYSPPHSTTTSSPQSPNNPLAPPPNPYPTVKAQKAFEKGLLDKTNKSTSDVILYDGKIVVFKMESDVMLYVVGGGDENEVLLYSVVLALRDALGILLK